MPPDHEDSEWLQELLAIQERLAALDSLLDSTSPPEELGTGSEEEGVVPQSALQGALQGTLEPHFDEDHSDGGFALDADVSDDHVYTLRELDPIAAQYEDDGESPKSTDSDTIPQPGIYVVVQELPIDLLPQSETLAWLDLRLGQVVKVTTCFTDGTAIGVLASDPAHQGLVHLDALLPLAPEMIYSLATQDHQQEMAAISKKTSTEMLGMLDALPLPAPSRISDTRFSSAMTHLISSNPPSIYFCWKWGGDKVEVWGSFNGWSRGVPLFFDLSPGAIEEARRVGGDEISGLFCGFVEVDDADLELDRGRVFFKFYIDGAWRVDPGLEQYYDEEEGDVYNWVEGVEKVDGRVVVEQVQDVRYKILPRLAKSTSSGSLVMDERPRSLLDSFSPHAIMDQVEYLESAVAIQKILARASFSSQSSYASGGSFYGSSGSSPLPVVEEEAAVDGQTSEAGSEYVTAVDASVASLQDAAVADDAPDDLSERLEIATTVVAAVPTPEDSPNRRKTEKPVPSPINVQLDSAPESSSGQLEWQEFSPQPMQPIEYDVAVFSPEPRALVPPAIALSAIVEEAEASDVDSDVDALPPVLPPLVIVEPLAALDNAERESLSPTTPLTAIYIGSEETTLRPEPIAYVDETQDSAGIDNHPLLQDLEREAELLKTLDDLASRALQDQFELQDLAPIADADEFIQVDMLSSGKNTVSSLSGFEVIEEEVEELEMKDVFPAAVVTVSNDALNKSLPPTPELSYASSLNEDAFMEDQESDDLASLIQLPGTVTLPLQISIPSPTQPLSPSDILTSLSSAGRTSFSSKKRYSTFEALAEEDEWYDIPLQGIKPLKPPILCPPATLFSGVSLVVVLCLLLQTKTISFVLVHLVLGVRVVIWSWILSAVVYLSVVCFGSSKSLFS
ncbi:hypothetical protein HDU91_000290 [Kappamyces sp. JEL0680]|nr:hypothetical protein HDU91_000290 [Kappamyces sp. JEL0680]